MMVCDAEPMNAKNGNNRIEEAFPMTTKEFLDRFAGAIPDFPDIEDEGPLQERDPL